MLVEVEAEQVVGLHDKQHVEEREQVGGGEAAVEEAHAGGVEAAARVHGEREPVEQHADGHAAHVEVEVDALGQVVVGRL